MYIIAHHNNAAEDVATALEISTYYGKTASEQYRLQFHKMEYDVVMDGETTSMNKLTRAQWEELDNQMSHTPLEPDAEDGVPGEHFKLVALLNRLGFVPISKQEAMRLAKELLDAGWSET